MSKALQWTLTDHVCRVCFGRLLRRPGTDGARVYRCTNCGAEAQARVVSSLCCCGMKLRSGRDMGLRCVPNTNPRPECLSEIVAEVSDVALPTGDASAHDDAE